MLELASACRRLETPRDRNIPFMPSAPQPSAASLPDDPLATRLLSVPSEAASEVQIRPAVKVGLVRGQGQGLLTGKFLFDIV